MGNTNTIQGFDKAVLQKRKEKRWVVYVRPNYEIQDGDGGGKRTVIADTVFARNYYNSSSYIQVSTPPRIAWIEEYIGTSFEDAKAKVVEFSARIGLDNVRLDRVVDLTTVLYPIS